MYEKLNNQLETAEEQYAAPEIEVIEMEILQHILSGSTELPGVGDGGNAW